MKLNKILTTLIISGTISFNLVACTPNNVGSNGGTSGNATTEQTLTTSPLGDARFTPVKNYFIEGVTSAISGNPAGGILPLLNAAKILIFGIDKTPDKPQQILDKLEKMDDKLSDLQINMENGLGLSTNIKQTLNAFYTEYLDSSARGYLTDIDREMTNIDNKYDGYVTQEAFGRENNVTDSEALFKMAKNSCNKSNLLFTLDMSAQTKSLQNISAASSTSDMFFLIRSNYAQSTGMKLLDGYDSLREKYLAQAVQAVTNNTGRVQNAELMDYINYFNARQIALSSKIYASYQQLYSMQTAQLAYSYGCNVNIPFKNIPDLPDYSTGEEGYKSAIDSLNKLYSETFIVLQKNLNNKLALMSTKMVAEQVNKDVFNAARPVLSTKTFSAESGVGSCSLKKFQLNHVSDTNGASYGVADISATCVSSIKDGKPVGVELEQQIPYEQNSSGKPVSYAYAGVFFDTQSKTLKINDVNPDNVDNSKWWINEFKDADIVRLSNPNYNVSKSSVQFSQYRGNYHIGFQGMHTLWGAAKVELADDIYLHNSTSYNLSSEQTILRPSSTYKFNSWYGGSIEVQEAYYNNWNKMYDDGSSRSYQLYKLANYNGKNFLININEKVIDRKDMNKAVSNSSLNSLIGLACLNNDKSCSVSQDGSTLNFTNGTKVTLSGSLAQGELLAGSGPVSNWKLTGTAPTLQEKSID